MEMPIAYSFVRSNTDFVRRDSGNWLSNPPRAHSQSLNLACLPQKPRFARLPIRLPLRCDWSQSQHAPQGIGCLFVDYFLVTGAVGITLPT